MPHPREPFIAAEMILEEHVWKADGLQVAE
jgi:hypothetical protein